MAVSKQSFHGGMITLDQIVSPLSVDVPNAVKMRIITMIDFANDTPILSTLVWTKPREAVLTLWMVMIFGWL
ncbi:hypothetical protein [Ruegeria lacuscaerulensis]|uniref:hypothetical protein n=1 Tax=Ruegeria lacuscaerulensis TaxID=55218 RepID=UPI001F30F26A|nr:hypothetical protein [Ruegeria lacuscaerulensis]